MTSADPPARHRSGYSAQPVFHPNQFRQSYFFQDTWKATPSLTLTLGLRYENFGQPRTCCAYPAFSGFDPARFLVRERGQCATTTTSDRPSAWRGRRRLQSGWLGRLFGDRKTVWRGGYQISYDAFFTQMISLVWPASTPNAISDHR